MPRLMAILVTDFFVALCKVFFGFKSQILTTLVKINITCHIRAERAGNGDSFDTGYSFWWRSTRSRKPIEMGLCLPTRAGWCTQGTWRYLGPIIKLILGNQILNIHLRQAYATIDHSSMFYIVFISSKTNEHKYCYGVCKHGQKQQKLNFSRRNGWRCRYLIIL